MTAMTLENSLGSSRYSFLSSLTVKSLFRIFKTPI